MNIYVASSWRNNHQPGVVCDLQGAGFEVYDFRNPEKDNHGFHWSEISPLWRTWTIPQYVEGLKHPLAEKGFTLDFDALKAADVCVLVLPCGRSSHLEAGYFVGNIKPLLIYCPERIEPELMYKMADAVYSSINDVIRHLKIIDK